MGKSSDDEESESCEDEEEKSFEEDEQNDEAQDEGGESGGPTTSGRFPKMNITKELRAALEDQFTRFDYDCSGAIDSEAELTMMSTNVAYMAYSEFHVTATVVQVDNFCEDLMDLVTGEGVGMEDFINAVVPAFGFVLKDGTKVPVPVRAETKKEADESTKETMRMVGLQEFMDELYGLDMIEFFEEGGSEADAEAVREAGKAEYFAMTDRVNMQWLLHQNATEWRAAKRKGADTSQFEQQYENYSLRLRELDDVEDIARKDRVRIGHSSCFIPGFSCLKEQEKLHKNLRALRTNPIYMWTMLTVNLVNVLTLMTQKPTLNCDGDDISDTYDSYQRNTLPMVDIVTNVIFTLDMILAMMVLGVRNYAVDFFNLLDFVVVITGWIDTAGAGANVSAFRALRVLRPLRLVKFFTGIQAIIGSIYYNMALIINVLSFMGFFMLVFGILAIQNFGGAYTQRCIVLDPVPTQTGGVVYDSAYSAYGEQAVYGEFSTFCANSSTYAPLGLCPSYQECWSGNENPHRNSASFDDFFSAFFVMFQVQTLSTWYEYDYYNMQSIGTLATLYNQGLIFLVGFIVSQLFVAVVCFGFESLQDQLNAPVFTDMVLGKPQLISTDDEEDDLCPCMSDEYHPLAGDPLKEPPDRGDHNGIRVRIVYKHHKSPPHPLTVNGDWPEDEATDMNPLCNGNVGVAVTTKRDSEPPPPSRPAGGANEDEYTRYRRVMAQMQTDKQYEEDVVKATPLGPASADPEIQEFTFDCDWASGLKVWSNETVWSADIMLRAQQNIHSGESENPNATPEQADEALRDAVQITYYKSEPKFREILEMTDVIKDHIEVDGETQVPDFEVHMRPKLRIHAPLLSDDSYLCKLNLTGLELISEIKVLILKDYQDRGLLMDKTTADLRLMIDEDFCDDNSSLWKACVDYVEEFDPLHSIIVFNTLIDDNEEFIMSSSFDTVIIVSILLNTLFLTFEHYDKAIKDKPYMSDAWDATLIIAGWIFNTIFIVEMLLKFYTMKGFWNYWRVGPNRFDFVIVMSSIINIFLDAFDIDIAILRVLKVFRALRVVRVLRRVESVREIIDAAVESSVPILNILTFMIVVLIVYACLGMQFYGNQFDKYGGQCDGKPRANFDNFYTAFFALFQVLTGSAWELVLFDCVNACESGGTIAAIFILSFFILSNYVILNLFIGAILASMSNIDDDQRNALTEGEHAEQNETQHRSREAQLFVNQQTKVWERNGNSGNLCTMSQILELPCARKTFEDSTVLEDLQRCGSSMTNKTCFCLGPENCFRKIMITIVENPYFDFFILIVIIYSTVLLALDNPSTRDSDAWVDFFNNNDYFFVVIFTVEFSMKIVSHGFAHTDNIELMLSSSDKVKQLCLGNIGRPSYLYDAWNYLDIIVLAVSYIGLTGSTDGPLKLLRLVRAFRPLRMVNRIQGMKLVLEALMDAVEPIGNVCVLITCAFLIFAILGVSLFKGKYWSCNQCFGDYCDTFVAQDQCFGVIDLGGYMGPSLWNNPAIFSNPLTYGTFHFDNVFSAYMTLFEVSTGDSWETMLWATTNVPDHPHNPPVCDGAWAWGLYMVVFVFVGQLFMIQLFVAVIIDTFVLREGSGKFTSDQGMLADVMKLNEMLIPEPKPPCPSEDGEYVADNVRSTAYLMFTDVRPLPMPGLAEYLEEERIPNVGEVETIPRLRRNIEQTEKQRDKTSADEVEIIQRMDEALDCMKTDLARKERDLKVFNEFTEESLAGQGVPDGCVYQCGVYFDNIITVCIIVNIFFMCTFHHNQPDGWTTAQDAQNIVFTIVFTAEMIIKHLGLGFKEYWSDPLNAFDGVVVTVSILFIPLEGGALAGLFRVCRIFRLIKRAPQIRALMITLVKTIPAISNVFMVLFLVFFIFAVIGVELFGKMRLGQSISIMANFSTWLDAMHVLWRNALGNWRSTMYETFVSFPECTNLEKDSQPGLDKAFSDCGDPIKGHIFFLSFMVVSAFAVLNLVIAIILNAFTWCYSLEPSEITGSLCISAKHLRHFKAIWDRFDIDGDASMPVSDLQCLLAVAQKNIPELFFSGYVNQKDEKLYTDYSSFGTGPGKTDANADETACRQRFESLKERLTLREHTREVFVRLEKNGEDVWNGDNTTVFEEDFERYNQTGTTLLLTKNDQGTTLEGVEYLSLIYLLVQEPLGLCAHDLYVCNRVNGPAGIAMCDPFRPLFPGYIDQGDSLEILVPDDEEAGPPDAPQVLKNDAFVPYASRDESSEEESSDEADEGFDGMMMKQDVEHGKQESSEEEELPEVLLGLGLEAIGLEASESSQGDSPRSQTSLLPPKISPMATPRVIEEHEDEIKAEVQIMDAKVVYTEKTSIAMVKWREEHRETLETYFVRYDLDKSGTLNDPDELQYLTINVIKATGIKCPLSLVDEALEPGMEAMKNGELWTFDEFIAWFHSSFVAVQETASSSKSKSKKKKKRSK